MLPECCDFGWSKTSVKDWNVDTNFIINYNFAQTSDKAVFLRYLIWFHELYKVMWKQIEHGRLSINYLCLLASCWTQVNILPTAQFNLVWRPSKLYRWTLLIVVAVGRDESTKNLSISLQNMMIIGTDRDEMAENLSIWSGQVEIWQQSEPNIGL